ncbi:hypothetical protein BJ170DRAFT_437797 [Xylariales sp. AK1849]|nr:hypothetical protein BJ170DRAFT_437797 [Xylariales sp. AK1849]
MMDHFNATVLNGAMISTRRGFQISKQKHNGTAFVNTSAQDVKQKKSTLGTTFGVPTTGKLTFVNHGEDGRKHTQSKKKTRITKDSENASYPRSTRTRKAVKDDLRRQSSCTTSSSSCSSQSSDDFLAEGIPDPNGHDNDIFSYLESLPAWASYKLPKDATDFSKRLLFMTLAFGPDDADPFDGHDNMTHDPLTWCGRHVKLVKDPTSLHCALTLGALFDAARSGQQDSANLNTLTSQLASIINRRLNEKDQSIVVRDVTIHAIASLAIIAGYQGKHDHWYVHMRGLLNLVDLAGGQSKLDPRTMSVIRKADFAGAIPAATKPCLPFIKTQHGIRHSLLQERHKESTDVVKRLMEACRLDSEIVDAIASATIKDDPEVGTEHYYHFIYRLLSYPEALRDFDEVISPCTSNKLALHAQDFPTPESINTATDTYTKAIESAMRILVLLYLREPTLKIPCGEGVLLDLLAREVGSILVDRQLEHIEDMLIDPTLLQESRSAQRPTLIWICIAGDLFWTSKMGTSSEHNSMKGRPSIYADLLKDVLGSAASANPDLMPDNDLELCRYLDLRNVVGPHWCERNATRNMLGIAKIE